jgi:hypothetical protein
LTGTCPPDEELRRFLADHMGDAEEQALKGHVATCAVCQRRVEQLNRGDTAGLRGPS